MRLVDCAMRVRGLRVSMSFSMMFRMRLNILPIIPKSAYHAAQVFYVIFVYCLG